MYLPRSPEEMRMKNYNPLLLMLWKANMDLQNIGESSLAIAQYITGYVTKAERSNMQDLWQEVSSHSFVYSKLWSFGVRSLRSRECGMYEDESAFNRHMAENDSLNTHSKKLQKIHRKRTSLTPIQWRMTVLKWQEKQRQPCMMCYTCNRMRVKDLV